MNLFQRIVSSLIVPSPRRETLLAEAQSLRFETLETRRLLATVALTDFSVSQGTGEKPQSKVWEYADQWWTVMPSSAGAAVWRLDGTTWTRTLQLSTNNNVTADVKAVGGLTHVLLFDGASSQLASIEYDGAGNYVPWTMRPQLVGVPLSGAETATIDVDTTGRLWVAADNGSLVQVRYSDGLYQSWSSPITVASGIGSDDISVITALPNGTVGVLWSNQNTQRFGYRYHVDGASPTEWSVAELPASAAALNTGGGMADDHLNVAVAADGTLYAAVKTSYDSGGQTKIGLIVRRPNGQWDNSLYPVDTAGTRAIVLLNEAAGKLIVAYAASEGTANIVYRETSLASINFGPRQTMIGGSIQNVSSTKQNFIDEVALIASNGGTVKSVLFSFGSIVANQAPVVDAGLNQSIVIGAAAALNAQVQDDGLPAAVTVAWSKFSGPGVVAFDDSSKLNARATFSLPGTYVLRITANDGQYFDADEVTIVVAAPAPDPSPSEIVAAAFQDGVAGYTGTRDTMIRALNANSNYGTLATLEMDGSPDIASLVAWDVSAIPVGSVVVSVSFELYVTNTTVHSYSVFAMERAWDELGATWNVAGVARPWSTAGASSATDRNGSALGSITSRSTGTLRVDLNAAGRAAVQEWINDPSSNHGLIFQNYGDASDGLDFRSSETSTVSQRPRLLITYETPGETDPPVEPQNVAPAVNAGADQTIPAGQSATLSGEATDDGLPAPLAVLWTKYSGPGSVTIGAAGNATTTASFSQAGTYVLRLSASDGQLSAQDEVTITVQSPAPPQNVTVTASFQDGIGGYAGTRDAMLRAFNASSNYGTINTLEVDGSPDIASLLSWDLTAIPSGSTVVSATLELYVTNTTDNNYQLLAMERAWKELEATWNQASTGLAWASGGAASNADRAAASLGVISPRSNGRYVVTLNAAGIAAVQRWIDDPAKNFGFAIQNYATASNGFDFRSRETADASQRPKLQVTYQTAAAGNESPPAETPVNQVPEVFAGVDRTTAAGVGIALNGSVTDDGPSAAVIVNWSRVSGPGAVTFGNNAVASTSATFAVPGTYLLRLSASDGQLTAHDDVIVEVTAAPPLNHAPIVSAGSDQTIDQGSAAVLAGTVTDDSPALGVTTTWSKISGPGSVAFQNASSSGTSATFSASGVYVLRLTASDGSLTSFDEATLTITTSTGADPSLAGDWRMDAITGGTIADSSGGGRAATIVGAPSLTTGVYGNALSVNKSDYLLVNNAPELNPDNQITIAAWIKPTTSGTQYVVRKGRQDSTDGFELSLSSDGKVFVRFNQASSGDSFRVNSTSKYPTNGSTWLHVAATYDGSTIKLYINGVLQASKSASFQIASNSLPLAIGAQDDGYRGFAGAIDGVKLFNRALTAAEIVALKANA